MGDIGGGAIATLIVALLVIVIVLVTIAKAVRIVPQARTGIVERLGRYHRTLSPGLSLLVPYVDRLKPLAVPGNPWFPAAGELTGIAYLKMGKNDLAGPIFAAISRDKQAPEALRARSRQMAGALGVDAIDDVAKAASGEPQ